MTRDPRLITSRQVFFCPPDFLRSEVVSGWCGGVGGQMSRVRFPILVSRRFPDPYLGDRAFLVSYSLYLYLPSISSWTGCDQYESNRGDLGASCMTEVTAVPGSIPGNFTIILYSWVSATLWTSGFSSHLFLCFSIFHFLYSLLLSHRSFSLPFLLLLKPYASCTKLTNGLSVSAPIH